MKMIAALVLVAAASATAAAQPASSSASDGDSLAAQDCAHARKLGKTCVLTFDHMDVGGKVINPDGTRVDAASIATFASLIRLRADFRAEIISSADWI